MALLTCKKQVPFWTGWCTDDEEWSFEFLFVVFLLCPVVFSHKGPTQLFFPPKNETLCPFIDRVMGVSSVGPQETVRFGEGDATDIDVTKKRC